MESNQTNCRSSRRQISICKQFCRQHPRRSRCKMRLTQEMSCRTEIIMLFWWNSEIWWCSRSTMKVTILQYIALVRLKMFLLDIKCRLEFLYLQSTPTIAIKFILVAHTNIKELDRSLDRHLLKHKQFGINLTDHYPIAKLPELIGPSDLNA